MQTKHSGEVGTYKDLTKLSSGSNLRAHHVGQKAVMKKLLGKAYNPNEGLSILVPKVGHNIKGGLGIVSRNIKGFTNARDLLARDIRELRRVYGSSIPNSSLQKLIQLNKKMYPRAFLK